MRNTLHSFLLVGAAGLLLAAVPARGGEFTLAGKSYLSLDLGLALQSNLDVDEISGVTQTDVELEFDPGIRLDVASGYHFSERFSAELSLGLVVNTVDSVTGTPVPAMNLEGELFQLPVMINLIYKVPTELPIEPFLGGGLGGVFNVYSADDFTEEAFTFGYQGFLGVKYRCSPQTEFTAAYKFLGTSDLDFDRIDTSSALVHAFSIGFRYSF